MGIFSIFAKPLGWLMSVMYSWIGSYFLTILLFTLLIRLLMFPLFLHQQKSSADRAKLAPRLERLQKKYAKDPKKLQEKQMELYQKEGVKMTAGCLPTIVTMLILFSVIAVIYKPLSYLHKIPDAAINASTTALTEMKNDAGEAIIKKNELSGYYNELGLLRYASEYPDVIKDALTKAATEDASVGDPDALYTEILEVKEEFQFLGVSFLDLPWQGGKINWLWLVAILSGVTALGTSLLSMHYTKGTMPQQPGQGCSMNAMMYIMPLTSLFISFGVPAGVGIYWIFSNLLAMVQTVVMNKIYNPAKIREQAEREYEERRRQRKADKERLKEARVREQQAWQKAQNEEAQKKKNPQKPQKTSALPVETAALREDDAEKGKEETDNG